MANTGFFVPLNLEAIRGTTVTWQNEDNIGHAIQSIDKPYNINVVLHPGENQTITLDANTTGIFTYYCTFHQPTMRGQLIVQPPPY